MNFAGCLLRSTGLVVLNSGPQGGSINGMLHTTIYKNLAQARDPICYHGSQVVMEIKYIFHPVLDYRNTSHESKSADFEEKY